MLRLAFLELLNVAASRRPIIPLLKEIVFGELDYSLRLLEF